MALATRSSASVFALSFIGFLRERPGNRRQPGSWRAGLCTTNDQEHRTWASSLDQEYIRGLAQVAAGVVDREGRRHINGHRRDDELGAPVPLAGNIEVGRRG